MHFPSPRVATRAWLPYLVAGYAVLDTAGAACAAGAAFPRGPGFYYGPVKLALVALSFFGWVRICAWVDADARAQKIEAMTWNALVLAAGLLGLLVLWNVAAFAVAWPLFWVLVLATLFAYVYYRDERAHETERILTQENLEALLQTYLKLSLRLGEKEKKTARKLGVPVRLLKRDDAGAGTDHASRVKQSKGYKAALEMIYEGVQRRATDIHLEPAADEMTVRFRIDGIMTNADPFTRATGDAVVNIFKVISNLDITEKRKPQDGSFSAQVEDRKVEFRVATAGSVQGEKMVMRLLDYSQAVVDLTSLGMSDAMRAQVCELVSRPHGMFLVCGPTGSGKTTTLYACLNELDRFQQNVITIENPVEYRLDNITQIEVNPKAGKTFASELRSILRQDPDVIMIGEIRDKETAEIACQAAQTGHMVLSTVHANDTLTALGRLIELGVPPFQVASALNAVLGQRLVRRLCKHCRQRYKPGADALARLGADPIEVKHLYRAKEAAAAKDDEDEEEAGACATCGGLGYHKRTGVYELFVMTDDIRELMRDTANLPEIKRIAVRDGLTTLFEYGAQLVVDGQTSLQELQRVCK